MKEYFGIQIKDEILLLSGMTEYLRPYLLN